jgi:hypothetical protein
VAAPREIVALLESVVDIYLSDVKHRERAAFILCDELVEMACKMRAREHDYRFDLRSTFHDAWNAPGVQLDPATLGRRVQISRDTRNLMQHGDAGVTVDPEHCASALLDAAEVVEHCWPGTRVEALRATLLCSLRVVHLYSTDGKGQIRQPFEDLMRDNPWTFEERQLETNEIAIRPGLRGYWRLAITWNPESVEEMLNQLDAL